MIAFVADVHLGNHRLFGGRTTGGVNDRAHAIADVLGEAARIAARHKAPLVVLGDLYDVANPTPQIVTEASRALHDATAGGLTPILLMGNHDQVSSQDGDHALGPHEGECLVVENPRVIHGDAMEGTELGLIPFRPGRAEDWLRSAVDGLSWSNKRGCPRVLCIHLGIRDDDTPAWLSSAHDSVPITLLDEIAAEHKLAAIVAGNWHGRKLWRRTFNGWSYKAMQVGALVPTGFDNPGADGYGTLALFDPRDVSLRHEEIPGPRFQTLTGLPDVRTFDSERRLKTRANREKWFVRARVLPSDEEAARFVLSLALGDNVLAGYEVETDTTAATVEARTAATVARSAATLAEALAGYVNEMPLDDGIDRAAVLSRARSYLGMP